MKFEIDGTWFERFDIKTKETMQRHLRVLASQTPLEISDYTFAANFIWLENVSGFYAMVEDCFCLFALTGSELSMLLPPLGRIENFKKACDRCFTLMELNNQKKNFARIDYVAENLLEKFADQVEAGSDFFGLFEEYVFEKSLTDYIYKTQDLIELKGNAYHAKRTEINKFKASYPTYKTEILDAKKHRDEILELASSWASRRLSQLPDQKTDDFMDGIFLEKAAIRRMLDYYEELELVGIVLFINEKLVAFTVGEAISETTASVIIEKSAFDFLGAAQFIFREFSKFLAERFGCEFVNVGDDMGFENLKKVKMSYRPHNLAVKYSIAKR